MARLKSSIGYVNIELSLFDKFQQSRLSIENLVLKKFLEGYQASVL